MKRFTETQKWADTWFRKITPQAKLLWLWLCDNCDAAGVIEPDMELASFQIGLQVDESTIAELGERIDTLPAGKLFVRKFIEFQYGKLSRDCKAHNPIFLSLEKNFPERESEKKKGDTEGVGKGIQRAQEKEKEQDTEKEKETDKTRAREADSPFPKSNQPNMTAIMTRVNGLRPEWKSPASWTRAEMEELSGGVARQIEEIGEEGWKLLAGYMAADVQKGAGFWQPQSRTQFCRSFSDVFAHAQRWATKHRGYSAPSRPKSTDPSIR